MRWRRRKKRRGSASTRRTAGSTSGRSCRICSWQVRLTPVGVEGAPLPSVVAAAVAAPLSLIRVVAVAPAAAAAPAVLFPPNYVVVVVVVAPAGAASLEALLSLPRAADVDVEKFTFINPFQARTPPPP